MSTVPFRLVRHHYPDGRANHLDLFLKPPQLDCLPTFEFPSDLAESIPGENGRLRVVPPQTSGKIWRGARKSDHRPLYWTFSGPIDGDRGMVTELARGNLSGDWDRAELFLVVETEP